ncbi:MAG: aminotransferase class I/II-fold pyridoxal phosphate-dependent enzyme [Negativicutes bacterium]|nr:aminotransferase class I/II-fold pyridoxal phosphate-dependent enzyme [Negativicutes bacterium]
MVATHMQGKQVNDKIFAASGAANRAIAQLGREKVVNATLGSIYDEQERLACLPVVEEMFRALDMSEIVNYAPVAGLPDFIAAAQKATFAGCRPDGYIDGVATSGGSGALHNAIWNYSESGDAVLTHDWFWSPYRIMTVEPNRRLETFRFFTGDNRFDSRSFAEKVHLLLNQQESLLVILNTPAHNPTGYSLSDSEWDSVIDILRQTAKTGKRLTLMVDIAYIDYAGEKNASRKFMTKFSGLPANVLILFAFSMSKGFTMYGQRTGAIIALSSQKEVIDEFCTAMQITGRSTWSNINRGCMRLLADIYRDKELVARADREREELYQLIRRRANKLVGEAEQCSLNILPYFAGFFITVPARDPDRACALLNQENIFCVPLAKGVRIAVCAVPEHKIPGVAAKVARAIEQAGGSQ